MERRRQAKGSCVINSYSAGRTRSWSCLCSIECDTTGRIETQFKTQ